MNLDHAERATRNGSICPTLNVTMRESAVEFLPARCVLTKESPDPIRHLGEDYSFVDLFKDAKQLLKFSGSKFHGTLSSDGPQMTLDLE
jgi:hypothetical protein